MKSFTMLCLILVFAPAIGQAQESKCFAAANANKIQKSIATFTDNYGNLPDRIDCKKPTKNQGILCKNERLKLMERLDHMAGVYSEESATGIELDHSEVHNFIWLEKMLKQCKTAECICSAYKENTDYSLGGWSPYYQP
jgi:hypothetical protein